MVALRAAVIPMRLSLFAENRTVWSRWSSVTAGDGGIGLSEKWPKRSRMHSLRAIERFFPVV